MMKPLSRLPLLLALLVVGCAEPEIADETTAADDAGYVAYGEPVVLEDGMVALTPAALTADPLAYDQTVVRVEGSVAEVCKMEGCWLTLANPTATPIRVQVPRHEAGAYVFTFPTDLGAVEAIVEGTVSVDTMSVEMLRHYAEDEGRPQSAIDAITEPEATIVLTARGALVAVPEIVVPS